MIEHAAGVNEKQETVRLETPLGNINNLIVMDYLKIYTSEILIIESIRQCTKSSVNSADVFLIRKSMVIPTKFEVSS